MRVRTRITDLIELQETYSAALDAGQVVPRVKMLELRLASAEVATAATALEVRVAGGAGYAQSSPTSRRFREAASFPSNHHPRLSSNGSWDVRRLKRRTRPR